MLILLIPSFRCVGFAIVLMSGFLFLPAQQAFQTAVPAKVTINANLVTFSWPADTAISAYAVYRKLPAATTWGTAPATLPDTTTTYTDPLPLNAGELREYRISQTLRAKPNQRCETYMWVGQNLPPTEQRGKVLLLIEETIIDSLPAEIKQFELDLIADGWRVARIAVARTASPDSVLSTITAHKNADSTCRALILLGHIPVPYSGRLNPDGHPDHLGAWPTDLYYAAENMTWTDFQIDDQSATRPENKNIPEDGKFDQSQLSSRARIRFQTGRIDFANLPAFTETEIELTRRYLQKNHRFRYTGETVARRALIDDNFGFFSGEAFAGGGWRAAHALVGPDSVKANLDFVSALNNESYLFAYGCGAGSYTSVAGVCNTSQLKTANILAPFTLLFGSYFGDFDAQDNVMRALLATNGNALTCGWSGRPHWVMHPMALGETIGECARKTQENTNLYLTNDLLPSFNRMITLNLLGDPTLRLHPVSAPANLTATPQSDGGVLLKWHKPLAISNLPIQGYHLYRAVDTFDTFERINTALITDTTFVDAAPRSGSAVYMVRALRTENAATGSYQNLSQGVFSQQIMLTTHRETDANLATLANIALYPNPVTDRLTIRFPDSEPGNWILSNSCGELICQGTFAGQECMTFEFQDLPAGTYIITVHNSVGKAVRRIAVIH